MIPQHNNLIQPWNVPTDDKECVTDVELSCLLSRSLNRLLPRSAEILYRHVVACVDCKLRLVTTLRALRRDQDKLRRLAGAPRLKKLAATDEDLILDCFGPLRPVPETVQELTDSATLVAASDKVIDLPDSSSPSTISHHLNAMHKYIEPSVVESRTFAPLYVDDQLKREVDEKQLVARWIAEDLPLTYGSSLFIDAGSQCCFAWRALLEKINRDKLSQLSVLTSSMLVLEDWSKNYCDAQQRVPRVQISGGDFDAPHLAFYGADKSRFSNFRPAAVLIGAVGIEVRPDGILLGYNAGAQEHADKKLLFHALRAKRHIVLATPSKIGDPGGMAFDILSLNPSELDSSAPIYIVTTTPAKGTIHEEALQTTLATLRSAQMQTRLKEKGLVLRWVTVSEGPNKELISKTEEFPEP
jgi:DeoR/GlpR family transcriptional regulator of sugar metabolism